MFKSMFSFSKNESSQYIYLIPGDDNNAQWELLEWEELDKRVRENLLAEGSRVFRVDQEFNIRFEKSTHLE